LPSAQQLKAFIRHWLHVVDEHSIHSPYFFDFYQQVIKGNNSINPDVEKLRARLLQNHLEVTVDDFGAGSTRLKSARRRLSDIAKTSISEAVYSGLYLRIIQFIKAKRIVELGTGLGVNTLYLAQDADCEVITFEGSPALANVALTNFEYFNKKNIELIEGNINTTLSEFLQDPAKINFALMDANHRYAATMKYFAMLVMRLNEESILVVDDIHWSGEMEKAWNELKANELVYGSIDLFRCGILFFEPGLNRRHYVLSL
jgi:predicted O-methyltransferase YrrM